MKGFSHPSELDRVNTRCANIVDTLTCGTVASKPIILNASLTKRNRFLARKLNKLHAATVAMQVFCNPKPCAPTALSRAKPYGYKVKLYPPTCASFAREECIFEPVHQ